MKCCFKIGGKIVSPSDFVIIAWTHAYSFLRLMVFFLTGGTEYESWKYYGQGG